MENSNQNPSNISRNKLALISITIGLSNFVCCFLTGGLSLPINLLVGLAIIVLGAIAYRQVKLNKGDKKDGFLAIVNIASGVILFMFVVVYFIYIIYLRETGLLY